jgi:hypothetical protein
MYTPPDFSTTWLYFNCIRIDEDVASGKGIQRRGLERVQHESKK